MSLRIISPDMSPPIVEDIDTKLSDLKSQHAVAIPLAVESGSRAWGFPSPDSDYDCRFVFIRGFDRYLSPWPRRDVIETPLEGALDINGWDLGKALKLMLNGNAVILEWLQSPIVYAGDESFRAAFLGLAQRCVDRLSIGRHYLHLGETQWRTYFDGGRVEAPLKKLFYALRPVAALRWLRLNPDARMPPMHFPTLMDQCDPPPSVRDIVADLLVRKAATRELGAAPLPSPLVEFIGGEFEQARAMMGSGSVQLSQVAQGEAEAFFRWAVDRFAPGTGDAVTNRR